MSASPAAGSRSWDHACSPRTTDRVLVVPTARQVAIARAAGYAAATAAEAAGANEQRRLGLARNPYAEDECRHVAWWDGYHARLAVERRERDTERTHAWKRNDRPITKY